VLPNAMFRKPVRLICGHDMAYFTHVMSRREIAPLEERAWLPLVPHFLETYAFTGL
jgi:hypothetical protein